MSTQDVSGTVLAPGDDLVNTKCWPSKSLHASRGKSHKKETELCQNSTGQYWVLGQSLSWRGKAMHQRWAGISMRFKSQGGWLPQRLLRASASRPSYCMRETETLRDWERDQEREGESERPGSVAKGASPALGAWSLWEEPHPHALTQTQRVLQGLRWGSWTSGRQCTIRSSGEMQILTPPTPVKIVSNSHAHEVQEAAG